MANRVIYNVQDVLIGPPSQPEVILSSNRHILQRIQRVNSFNYSFNVNRKEILQLGTNKVVTNAIVDSPNVQLSLNYISHNISNESKLGLNVNWNLSGAPHYPRLPLISGIVSNARTQDRRNVYLVIGSGDIHQTGVKTYLTTGVKTLDFADPSASGFTVACFENCYLTSYQVKASVGEFIQDSVEFIADNISILPSGSGIKIPVTNRKLRTQENSDIEFVIPKYYTEAQPSALRPGDINFTFPTISNVGADFNDFKIESFELSVSLSRLSIQFLGQNIPVDRPPILPVYADLALSLLVGDSQSGSLMELVRQDVPYNFSITIRNPLLNPAVGQSIALRYDFSGAYFQGVDYSSSIGSNKSANLRFRTELVQDSLTTGLFMSGIVDNPDLIRMALQTEAGDLIQLEDLSDGLEIEPLLLGPTTF
jgi:hypothetical protein